MKRLLILTVALCSFAQASNTIDVRFVGENGQKMLIERYQQMQEHRFNELAQKINLLLALPKIDDAQLLNALSELSSFVVLFSKSQVGTFAERARQLALRLPKDMQQELLLIAVFQNNPDLVAWLLSAGVDVNTVKKGATPLSLTQDERGATYPDYQEVAGLLVDAGAQ